MANVASEQVIGRGFAPRLGTVRSESPWVAALRQLVRHRLAMVGAALIIIFILASIFAPIIAPYDPIAMDLPNANAHFSRAHPLGSDQLGRDMLSRIIYGARTSLMIGVLTVMIAAIGGTWLGLLAGYHGGRLDQVTVGIIDLLLPLPTILFAVLLIAIFGVSIRVLIIAIGVRSMPTFVRLARSMVFSLKETEFVMAANAIGCSGSRIVLRHLLPQVLGPISIQATFLMAGAIRTAAGLSFLGIGVPPPTPEWGSMLASGRALMRSAPHLTLVPGLTLVVVIMGFNLFGDGIRDALDPRMQKFA